MRKLVIFDTGKSLKRYLFKYIYLLSTQHDNQALGDLA